MKRNFISVKKLVLTAIMKGTPTETQPMLQCSRRHLASEHFFFVEIVTHSAVLACGVKQLLVVRE